MEKTKELLKFFKDCKEYGNCTSNDHEILDKAINRCNNITITDEDKEKAKISLKKKLEKIIKLDQKNKFISDILKGIDNNRKK